VVILVGIIVVLLSLCLNALSMLVVLLAWNFPGFAVILAWLLRVAETRSHALAYRAGYSARLLSSAGSTLLASRLRLVELPSLGFARVAGTTTDGYEAARDVLTERYDSIYKHFYSQLYSTDLLEDYY
jgi:hypothetical protein